MDIETEKVIELVFPDGIPDSWKDNPDFYQYLTKLGGLDVDQLMKEPDHLTDEKNLALQNTQELAYSNYKTFIQTAENCHEIFREFNSSENHLENLLEKIPVFVDKCQSFCDKSKEINSHRRLNDLTLKKSSVILEILEMPQLMETCLRSSQYNEALELSQYARQLGSKHSEIPIVASVVKDIENSWSGMVGQVVGSLRGDLPLAKCLQLVGLLRSMDAFTEAELRIKFLQARDSWFQGLLNAIPKEDSNFHLTKTIELSRIHLFNIITQYRAMFNDDDHSIVGRDNVINESAIFCHWLEEKLSQFLATLEHDLPNVTSIDSILGQCTYFGLSFGRVGADFTTRMSTIFIQVISNKFLKNIHSAIKKFEKDMETFTLINKLHRADVKLDTEIKSENPPDQLVNFYPLAEYCNGLISTFNELRLCSPVALSEFCTSTLEESLMSVAKGILVFYKQEQQAFTATERDNMVKFVECFSDQLIPYVQFCIHAIFPQVQVAAHLGITVNQLQKEGITYLNRKKIVEPLISFLPIKSMVQDPLISITLPESLSQPSTQRRVTLTVEKTPELEPVINIAEPQTKESKVEVESNEKLDDKQIKTNDNEE
ncbi:Similar to Cog8: Conserved oligomeric Golgi complex subunit 8 (Drosophila melanogaster) [Cotesia congregata]|uniref:Conserved oligomeric Golgi complex subunit 8 n=1 Tax=Cotesia congregata TaxID=51543 RepID=A0A8J2MP10_COTCN|nr:Similar to Cog8: Conserved oligomeric Golgi complex subunit 8 (Drosophila melanogaster) [Cotesia congregata]